MKFFLFCLTSDDDDYSYIVLLHLITLFNDLVGFIQSTIKPEWHSVQAVRGTTSRAHTLLITNSFLTQNQTGLFGQQSTLLSTVSLYEVAVQ